MRLCGISSRFQLLSPSARQVTHALLTRPPLSHNIFTSEEDPLKCFVRLACVKHAASVHPEPGSNSHVKWLVRSKEKLGFPCSVHHFCDVYCFKVATCVAVLVFRKTSSNPLRFFSLFGLRQIRLSSRPVPDNSVTVQSVTLFFLMILKIFQGYFTV